jgi:LEA14-like dessication related protein
MRRASAVKPPAWAACVTLVAVALAALAVVGLPGCASIERPKVYVEDVRWVGLSTDGIELEVTVKVDNPNAFAAEADKLTYTLELNGVRVVEGRQIERATVPASSSAEVAVPVTVTWEGGAKALEDILEGGEHTWHLTGSVTLRNGMLARTFRFSERGSFVTEGDGGTEGGRKDL